MSGNAGDSTRTIGPILQEARTAKGLTIEAAAGASKVPLSYVRLMEQEQFHLVPDSVYLTRFLTEYAVFLGLDPKRLLAQLKQQMDMVRTGGPSHSVSLMGSQIDLRRLLIYLLPAAAVIPLIFIGLSLFPDSPPTTPPTQTTLLPSAETGKTPSESLTGAQGGPQATPSDAEQPTGVTPAKPTNATAIREPQGPPARYRLRADAKETTWLAVSVDGAPQREALLLHPGKTAQWSANNKFTVTIGNPRGITLSLNNRVIALKGEPGQVIRDLVLPADGEPPPAGQ